MLYLLQVLLLQLYLSFGNGQQVGKAVPDAVLQQVFPCIFGAPQGTIMRRQLRTQGAFAGTFGAQYYNFFYACCSHGGLCCKIW